MVVGVHLQSPLTPCNKTMTKKTRSRCGVCVCFLHVKHAELHSKVVAEMEHQTAGDAQEGEKKR